MPGPLICTGGVATEQWLNSQVCLRPMESEAAVYKVAAKKSVMKVFLLSLIKKTYRAATKTWFHNTLY